MDVAREGNLNRETIVAKKTNKPAAKQSKKGKKISAKKELAKAQTLRGVRNLRVLF
jgi:hypothetical protein